MKLVKNKRCKVLAIYDRGGQKCFADLHDLMNAPGGTCYVVVFSLVDLQSETPAIRKKAVGQLVASLNSITVHADTAPVLLVGTRKDQVKPTEKDTPPGEFPRRRAGALRELSDQLEAALQHCPAFKCREDDGDLCFFAIENSRGFEGDETVRNLAMAIDKATDALPVMQKRVPADWLAVYDAFRSCMEQSPPRQWLSLSDVTSIAADCGMPHRSTLTLEQETRALLVFFHSLGAVLWFDEPGLRDLVTLDPQWVIDGVSCVIRNFEDEDHGMDCDKAIKRAHGPEWRMLTREARLHTILPPLLWTDPRFAEHQDRLLQMMVRFGLAVPVRGKEELLVPPLLVFTSTTPTPLKWSG
jgi:hypothetical protein